MMSGFVQTGFVQPVPRLPNSWAGDSALRSCVAFHLGDDLYREAEPELAEMGRVATDQSTLELSARAEREPPVHVPYSTWGERIDEIRVSDAYLELGRVGVEAGVTALPYERSDLEEKARVVWAGLIALWGPSSALYSCPVAMTDAAARTLIDHGDESVASIVERLTTRDFSSAWTSGQWMTEMSGGSDIGRTETVARRDGDVWRLFGTKWFTSATTSEMALTLARPEGAGSGSAPLVMFRIQRVLDDGSRNAIVVRRLKDKLGTRSLPTAELELEGALAWPVGDPNEGGGVRKIATMLNITRIHNALGSVGSLARGIAWARAYAEVREVFGMPLKDMPAHRATLTDLAVDYAATLALTFRCCELTGKVEHGVADDHERALLRGLTPIAKLAAARWAVAGAAEAMEAVGGVGYCEDSTLPALVRNTHVQPIWEGTTNVLSLDLLRAAERQGAVDALFDDIEFLAEGTTHPSVVDAASSVKRALGELRDRWPRLQGDSDAHAGARPFALGLATTYACARLCAQAEWSVDHGDARPATAASRLAARGLVAAPGPSDTSLALDD